MAFKVPQRACLMRGQQHRSDSGAPHRPWAALDRKYIGCHADAPGFRTFQYGRKIDNRRATEKKQDRTRLHPGEFLFVQEILIIGGHAGKDEHESA